MTAWDHKIKIQSSFLYKSILSIRFITMLVTSQQPTNQVLDPATGKPIPFRSCFQLGSVFLIILAIAQVIAGAICIQESSAYYIGGVYVGFFAFVAASCGLCLRSRSAIMIFNVFLGICVLVAIIGSAVQGASLSFVNSIEACSTYQNSDLSDACGVTSSTAYTCAGNSDYYTYAYACQVSYVIGNTDYTNQCSCVTNTDDGTCYSYSNINDCNQLLTGVPKSLAACLAFAIITLIVSLIILILGCMAYNCPTSLGSEPWFTPGAQQTVPITHTNPMVIQGTVIQGYVIQEPGVAATNENEPPVVYATVTPVAEGNISYSGEYAKGEQA
jgi:hypothetical protein